MGHRKKYQFYSKEMKITENIYLSFYFAIRNDKNWNKINRVRLILETVLMMIISSLQFLILGLLNIRTDNMVVIGILILISWFSANSIRSHITHKESDYIRNGNKFKIRTKRILAFYGILILILSMIFMILSAILMSYLWSLKLF